MAQERPELIRISPDPIDLSRLIGDVTTSETGGVATFIGVVRSRSGGSDGAETLFLDYECFDEMAVRKMQQVILELRARWPQLIGVSLVQRTGEVRAGDAAVAVACSAAHRDDGVFEAARMGIDRIKEIVPVWKQEMTQEGARWVEGDYVPRPGE